MLESANCSLQTSRNRVIAVPELDSSKPRISIVSFVNTSINNLLEPLPKFINAVRGKSKYPSINRSDFPLVGNMSYINTLQTFRHSC